MDNNTSKQSQESLCEALLTVRVVVGRQEGDLVVGVVLAETQWDRERACGPSVG